MLAVAGICWGIACACGKEDDVSGGEGGGGLVNPLHPGERAVLTVATGNGLEPEGRRD